jgi:hypothetical protein
MEKELQAEGRGQAAPYGEAAPAWNSLLRIKSIRYDSNRCADADRYGAEAGIKISRDDFYRHGWELSATDISAFNNIMAGRAKILLCKTVGLYRAFNYRLTECIDIFRNKYGFSEDVRPQESIRKNCRRNLKIHKGDIDRPVAGYVEKFDSDEFLTKKS